MALTEPERAKKFKLFRNGDDTYSGRYFVLNKRRIRTWDSFLQAVTNDVKSSEAVRSIRTPVGGTRVETLEALSDSNNYVAVGAGKFKKMGYLKLEDPTKKTLSPRHTEEVKPVEHSRIQVSGRIRKIPTDVITIHVYANGKVLEPARRVTLTHAMLRNWVTVLAQITDKVNLTSGATRRLYTLEGVQVNEAKDLQTTHFYVAVGADIGGFKKMEYGSQRPAFNISPKRERRKLDPIVMPPSRKRGSRKTTQNGSLDSSMNGSSSKSTPASDKSLRQPHRVRPIEKRPQARREEDGPFHAKPVKHKRIPEPDRQPEVDYDKDEGGVFKAKDHSRETDGARPVDDTDDTKVDLPIDQVEAEEVQDEDLSPEKQETNPRTPTPNPSRSASPIQSPEQALPTPSPTASDQQASQTNGHRSPSSTAENLAQEMESTPVAAEGETQSDEGEVKVESSQAEEAPAGVEDNRAEDVTRGETGEEEIARLEGEKEAAPEENVEEETKAEASEVEETAAEDTAVEDTAVEESEAENNIIESEGTEAAIETDGDTEAGESSTRMEEEGTGVEEAVDEAVDNKDAGDEAENTAATNAEDEGVEGMTGDEVSAEDGAASKEDEASEGKPDTESAKDTSDSPIATESEELGNYNSNNAHQHGLSQPHDACTCQSAIGRQKQPAAHRHSVSENHG